MKAVVKVRWEPNAIEVKDVDKPEVEPDEVLARVIRAGICGSDVEIYKATMPVPVSVPRIVGHEFSGVVAEIGKKVNNVEVGDRVVAESGIVCRRCRFCMAGRHNLCLHRAALGFAADGAFAEYVKVPAVNVHRLPNNISFEEGALTEPISVAVHAIVERAHVSAGDTVAIVGPGTIGLLALQVAKLAGASKIIVTGLGEDKGRLGIAKKLGADEVVNVEEQDPIKMVYDLTDNFGADVAVEASGSPRAFEQAVAMTRRGGSVVLIGLYPRPIEKFNASHIVSTDRTILGSWTHSSQTWNRALSIIASGRIAAGPLITHVLPFEEVEHAFDLLEKKEAIKILLKPD